LAEFLEIYGLPMRLGTYPAGATESEKFTLLRAVMEIGHRAAGIVPEGMKIDFKEAAKGNSDPFESMIKWCELSQSKAILGGTLTTQSDGKSSTNALGNIHEVARIEIRDSDAKQLAASISRDIVASMMRLNYPNVHPRRYPKFAFDLSEPEDITTFSEAIPKLAGVNGMRIGAEWLHTKLSIPMAGEDEAILTVGSTATPTALTAALGAHRAALAAKADPVKREHANIDTAERGIDDATTGDDWDNNIADMSAKLGQALVDKLSVATSYNEALALLSNAEPNQDVDELAANLEQYLCAAGLWGALHRQSELQPLELPAGDV
jgi:phage gp29-like protein